MNKLNMNRRWVAQAIAVVGLAGIALAGAVPSVQAKSEPAYAIVTMDASAKSAKPLQSSVQAWRKSGLVGGAQTLLAAPDQPEAGFTSVAVLNFSSEKAYDKWRAQTRSELGSEARVRRADLVRAEGKVVPQSAKPVYVVSFYDSLVSAAEYKTYTDKYIAPNMNSQRGYGVMADYAMFLEREPEGANGRAVLLMGYKDPAAFARREEVKKQGSQKLLQDPDWKRYNDIKKAVRTHTSETVATFSGGKP